jgi:FlaA1/EpsC-like NDP-sugar epimerase
MINELAQGYDHHPDDIQIENIGVKPGEKLYEELMSHEETRRTWELELYFAVLPAFRCMYRDIDYDYPSLVSNNVNNPYNSASENVLEKDELRQFLRKTRLFEEAPEKLDHPDQRY